MPNISSSFNDTENVFTINANHMNICKYAGKDDNGYRKVLRELQNVHENIQIADEKRLEEERAIALDKQKERQNLTPPAIKPIEAQDLMPDLANPINVGL